VIENLFNGRKVEIMSEPIRLLISDSLRVFRECLTSFLVKQKGLAVVGQAEDIEETLQMTKQINPDVVLIGSSLNKGEALKLTYEISTTYPDSKVLIMGLSEIEQTVFEFIEAGASAYTLKHGSLEELVKAIEGTCRGEAVCSPRIAYSVSARIAQLSRSNFNRSEIHHSLLTEREEEVLQLLADGLSNKHIAARLCISLSTVKNHVHNILEKLDVRNRAEAISYALKREKSTA
jgi:DNA-binding NarL/FixJ family response regulator